MKLYHDADEDDNWTEVTGVVDYPSITTCNNMYGLCTVVLRDFEGALYSTWYSRDFCPMKLEDNDSNILFRGYLAKKNFTEKTLILHLVGIGVKLEWRPFNSNYILAEGKVKQVDADAELHVYYDDNENNSYDDGEEFSWDDDQWISGEQDRGLLIVDNTTATISKTWDGSAVIISGEDDSDGNVASTHTKDDGDELSFWESSSNTYSMTAVFDIDGTTIPDSHSIQKFEIDYQFGIVSTPGASAIVDVIADLQIKKDTEWISVKTVSYHHSGATEKRVWSDTPLITIEESAAELAKYFTTEGGNFTELKGMQVVVSGTCITMGGPATVKCEIDFINVIVYHNSLNISPIMESITDSATSSLTCAGITWTTTGVAINDSWKIGQNTTAILSDIINQAGLTLLLKSTLSKYIARHYKGVYCIDALNSVCQLEGLIWCEDYENNAIKVIKKDDFEDSEVDLVVGSFDRDWDFEDACNQVRRIEVWGNASYNIFGIAEDFTVSGNITKIIIDDSIMTQSDAKEVADTQLEFYKDKRPSIRLSLHGVNTALQLGTTVDITFARPTIAKDAYPIRMIERKPRGIDEIETIIHAGLGETEWDEKLGMNIRKINSLARQTLTNKLISTPWSAGAIISYGDIVGFGTGVRDIIDAEIVNGESIDAAIDALIAAHHDAASNDHDDRYYTETETDNFKLNKWQQPDGNIAMNSKKFTGLVDPADNQDSATKKYADDKISNLAYDPDNWNNVTDTGASKDAIRDAIVPLSNATVYQGTYDPDNAYPADPRGGDIYVLSKDGYKAADGNTPARFYEVGDWIIWNATTEMWNWIRNVYGNNVWGVSPGDDIQVAIDEAESIGAGVVLLLPGTHTLSAALTVNNVNVDIVVEGVGETSIIDVGGDRSAFDITNAKSVKLRNFKIDAADLTTDTRYIIDIDETADNRVICEHITIIGDGTNGHGIQGVSKNIIVRNCYINAVKHGIVFAGDKNKAYENEIIDCASRSIYISGDKCSIFDNYCDGSDAQDRGISIAGDRCDIRDNKIFDCDKGIYLADTAQYNTIISNISNSNDDDGIYLDGDENIIMSNILASNTDGIHITANATNNFLGLNKIKNSVANDINDNSDGSNYIIDPSTDRVTIDLALFGDNLLTYYYLCATNQFPNDAVYASFYIPPNVDPSQDITITILGESANAGGGTTIDGLLYLYYHVCDGTVDQTVVENFTALDFVFGAALGYIEKTYTLDSGDIEADSLYYIEWQNDDGDANDNILIYGIQITYYVKRA